MVRAGCQPSLFLCAAVCRGRGGSWENILPDCLIAFGANLGDPAACLQNVSETLKQIDAIRRIIVSNPVITSAVGGPADQPKFVNAAIRFQTPLPPEALHQHLITIESKFGRQRGERWGPRSIDLDLLLYGKQTIRTPTLEVPHRRMSFRRFVLEPASEIASDMIHPTSGLSIQHLLDHLDSPRLTILLVGFEQKTIEIVARDSPSRRNDLKPVQSLHQFILLADSARLVVVRRPDDSTLEHKQLFDRAFAFAGPMLDVTESPDPASEILAALEAST